MGNNLNQKYYSDRLLEKSYEIIKVYQDAGYTGKNDERPAFQEMYEASKKSPKPFEIILVWRGNRIFRNVEQRLAYRRLFARHEIRFVSLHEPDLEGATGRFLEVILAATDECE